MQYFQNTTDEKKTTIHANFETFIVRRINMYTVYVEMYIYKAYTLHFYILHLSMCSSLNRYCNDWTIHNFECSGWLATIYSLHLFALAESGGKDASPNVKVMSSIPSYIVVKICPILWGQAISFNRMRFHFLPLRQSAIFHGFFRYLMHISSLISSYFENISSNINVSYCDIAISWKLSMAIQKSLHSAR